jgi:hypothetical protein
MHNSSGLVFQAAAVAISQSFSLDFVKENLAESNMIKQEIELTIYQAFPKVMLSQGEQECFSLELPSPACFLRE